MWICCSTGFCFFLGVHPCDKSSAELFSFHHFVSFPSTLRWASKVALCCVRNRAAVFALSLNNAESSIWRRLETRHLQSSGGEPRSL